VLIATPLLSAPAHASGAFTLSAPDVTPFIGPGLMRVGGCGHAAAPC
jgi:hypothetical protein